MPDEDFTDYTGWMAPPTPESESNVLHFAIKQMIGALSTCKLVKVLSVDVGKQTVDVQPLVHQADGAGVAQPHGTVHGLPFVRWQRGKAAIIANPAVGDIGLAVVCDRDSSSAKSNRDFSNPGSFRKFSMSDGMYFGGVLNDDADVFVYLEDERITMTPDKGETRIEMTPGKIEIIADEVHVHGRDKYTWDTKGMGHVYKAQGYIIENWIIGATVVNYNLPIPGHNGSFPYENGPPERS